MATKARKARSVARKVSARKTQPVGRGTKKKTAARRTRAHASAPKPVLGLGEEDQVREAKYLPRTRAGQRLEQERFAFPETYGVNRVRLLVRDPEWLFAHWDVSPEAMKELLSGPEERSSALSQLTLRIVDIASGAVSDVLLPPGARWWYVRTDAGEHKYRAELGLTLASGEFRRLAWSNSVATPKVGPSSATARRLVSYAALPGSSGDPGR